MDKLKKELHQKIEVINTKKKELSDEEVAMFFLAEILAESREPVANDKDSKKK